MTKIYWNSNSYFVKNEGYKTSRDEITSRLIQRGFDIEINPTETPKDICLLLDNNIRVQYVNKSFEDSCKIVINNTLPDSYVKCDGYNIGFTYWETNKLPDSWVEQMNQMDEIWTTSAWAVDVFRNSGVTVPVYGFRLGIDERLYYPKKRERLRPFTFLSIGSPSTRKNSQMTVDAYVKLFRRNDKCRLLYKSIDVPDARINPRTEYVQPLYNQRNIYVFDHDMVNSELAHLYDMSSCVVYPTSGEGWGLMPIQGIAKGIPTICTNATSCTEYAHLSVPLDFEEAEVQLTGVYSDSGTWAKPNFDDLCDKMLYVYNNYEEVAELTYNNIVENYKYFTWDYAIDGFESRLCQILKNIKKKQS